MNTAIEASQAEPAPRRRVSVADHEEFLAGLLRPADIDELEEFSAEPERKADRP